MNRLFRRQLLSLMIILWAFQGFRNDMGAVYAQRGGPLLRSSTLGRGVNFGEILEAPNEGDWGYFLDEELFDMAAQAGFAHIRLPISWTYHTDLNPPYAIDPVFLNRVQWAVNQAMRRGLKIIINNHHYDELNANPLGEWQRAIAIWQQVANRFKGYGPRVYFEILNEPHGAFNDQPELWNLFMVDSLQVIRQTNPTRRVLVGPTKWNSIAALPSFNPPPDAHLIATVHCYDPFEFTHQGAEWVDPVPPLGATWDGNRYVIGNPWQNWSWDTSVVPETDGLRVTYNKGWAGLNAHNETGAIGATKLDIAVDQAMSLHVRVSNGKRKDDFFLNTEPKIKTYTIQLDPRTTPIKEIFIQNNSPNPTGEFRVSKWALVDSLGVRRSVIKQERVVILDALKEAADWTNNRRMSLYLGEFGAYEKGDMNSRLKWTKSIRAQAELLNIDWGYWGFVGGFGVYHPDDNSWNVPLLRTLIPVSGN